MNTEYLSEDSEANILVVIRPPNTARTSSRAIRTAVAQSVPRNMDLGKRKLVVHVTNSFS